LDRANSHASGTKLRLGFADANEGVVTVRLVARALNAERRLTQVLFFRFPHHRARLAMAQTPLNASTERLRSIAALVADKVAPHLADNIGRIGKVEI